MQRSAADQLGGRITEYTATLGGVSIAVEFNERLRRTVSLSARGAGAADGLAP